LTIRNARCAQLLLAASLLLLGFSLHPVSLNAQTAAEAPTKTDKPTDIAPTPETNPDLKEGSERQSPQPAQEKAVPCEGNWTPSSCSVENEAFVRRFELLGLIALPCLFSLLGPLFIPRIWGARISWWAASWVQRWAISASMGFLLSALVLVGLPWMGIPILLRAGFIAGCRPCAASVSNYAPLGVPWGLPQMGMAILSPISLLIYLAIAAAVWSTVYVVIFWLGRKRSGFTAQAYRGQAH
jgi:hypothetical protein